MRLVCEYLRRLFEHTSSQRRHCSAGSGGIFSVTVEWTQPLRSHSQFKGTAPAVVTQQFSGEVVHTRSGDSEDPGWRIVSATQREKENGTWMVLQPLLGWKIEKKNPQICFQIMVNTPFLFFWKFHKTSDWLWNEKSQSPETKRQQLFPPNGCGEECVGQAKLQHKYIDSGLSKSRWADLTRVRGWGLFHRTWCLCLRESWGFEVHQAKT